MERYKNLIVFVTIFTFPILISAAVRDPVDLDHVIDSMAMLNLQVPTQQLPELFLGALTGSVPYILENFGQLTMPVHEVFNMIGAGNPSTDMLNNAFNSLDLKFENITNLFTVFGPMDFELFKNLGFSLLDVLSKILRTILNDLQGFLRIVDLLNLNPTQLQTLLLLGTERDLFEFVKNSAFTEESLREIADILNIEMTFSGVLSFFGVFNGNFAMKFCEFVTDDLFKLFNTLGLSLEGLQKALQVLEITSQILQLEFIQSIVGTITGQKLFANVISPTTALTKKGNGLLSIFMQISQFLKLDALPLSGGGAKLPISFEDVGNFTQITALEGVFSDSAFKTTNRVDNKDLANCLITELVENNVVGVVSSVVFEGGIFKLPQEGISPLVEGTPLVCSDLLMGILDGLDGLFFNFRPLQPIRIVKNYDFRNPFFDLLNRFATFGNYYMWLALVNLYLMLKDYVQ